MSKEIIDKKVEELAKEAAAAGTKEKKQDIQTWMYIGHNSDTKALIISGPVPADENKFNLVRESDYKKLAAELKVAKYDLQKLADLVDKKNAELDQMCDEKQTVPASLFDETKARLEMCRKKLKKLGAWGGE